MIIGKTGLSDQRILPVSVIFDTGPEWLKKLFQSEIDTESLRAENCNGIRICKGMRCYDYTGIGRVVERIVLAYTIENQEDWSCCDDFPYIHSGMTHCLTCHTIQSADKYIRNEKIKKTDDVNIFVFLYYKPKDWQLSWFFIPVPVSGGIHSTPFHHSLSNTPHTITVTFLVGNVTGFVNSVPGL